MNEINMTMKSHGMSIDARHVMLLADLMTYKVIRQICGIKSSHNTHHLLNDWFLTDTSANDRLKTHLRNCRNLFFANLCWRIPKQNN